MKTTQSAYCRGAQWTWWFHKHGCNGLFGFKKSKRNQGVESRTKVFSRVFGRCSFEVGAQGDLFNLPPAGNKTKRGTDPQDSHEDSIDLAPQRQTQEPWIDVWALHPVQPIHQTPTSGLASPARKDKGIHGLPYFEWAKSCTTTPCKCPQQWFLMVFRWRWMSSIHSMKGKGRPRVLASSSQTLKRGQGGRRPHGRRQFSAWIVKL